MDIQGVFPPHFQPDLPDRLDKWLALNIADRAADLRNHHIRVRFLPHPVNEPLDLVRNVGDRLHRGAQISALALPADHVGIDFSGRQIGIFVQILVNKPLIMAQIQICLRPVLRYINLSVLIGAHGSRIHIDVGIQLLCGHLQPPGFQQPAQGCRRDALSQSGDHAARHKDILGHVSRLPSHHPASHAEHSLLCFRSHSSASSAAFLPSASARTTRDWPVRMSPAENRLPPR